MDYPGAGPPPAGVEPNVDNPRDLLHTINYVTQGLTVFFVSGFFTLRIWFKARYHRQALASDDYATFAAFFFMLAYCTTACFAGYYGGGYDIWEVSNDDIRHFYKSGYAATLAYAPMALFVKIALVVMIIRVFGSVHKKTRIGLYVFLGMIIVYYVSGFFIKMFICRPIPTYWNGPRDNCFDESAIIVADSIISLISDLVILLVPTPLTWSLQLPVRKRLRVMGILCAGGVATAFSVYRLGMILTEGTSGNATMVFIKVILSGNAEVGIGIICACLPAVSAWFIRLRHGTEYGGYSNQTGRSADGRNAIMMTRTFQVQTEEDLPEDTQSKHGSDETVLITKAESQQQIKDLSERRSESV